jgi:hypothetical protein
MLARLINADLSMKNPEQINVALLAELQVSLERAASVLNEQQRLRKWCACSGAKLDAELGGGLADHEQVYPQLAPRSFQTGDGGWRTPECARSAAPAWVPNSIGIA